MTPQPAFAGPLAERASVDPGFWPFVHRLPKDPQERMELAGTIRYAPKPRRLGLVRIMHAETE